MLNWWKAKLSENVIFIHRVTPNNNNDGINVLLLLLSGVWKYFLQNLEIYEI